jgi:hypothetical protein
MCTLVADDRVGLVFKTKGAVSVYDETLDATLTRIKGIGE